METSRFANAALAAAGLLTLLLAAAEPGSSATPLVQHRQYMVGLLGVGLVAATLVPSLRLTAVAAALLSKVGLLAIAVLHDAAVASLQLWTEVALVLLLAAAGVVLVRDRRRESLWEGARI